MKKIIFLLTLLSVVKFSNAQPVVDSHPWCPPGATWVYDMFCQTCNLYYELSYEKDSTLLGYSAKKLKARIIQMNGFDPNFRLVFNQEPVFLIKSGDSISLFDNMQLKFLYKIKNTLGDRYIVNIPLHECASNPSYNFLDSVEIMESQWKDTINGVIYSSFKQKSSTNSADNWIIDNIGPRLHFFNRPSFSLCNSSSFSNFQNTFLENLKCYSDSLRGNISFYDRGGFSCYSVRTTIKEENKNTSFDVFPNPTDGFLYFKSENLPPFNLVVYDITGRAVLTKSNLESPIKLDILNKGIYIAEFRFNNNFLIRKKIIYE